MAYVLLIMENPQVRRSRSAEEGRAAYARMARFTEDLKARGLHVASDSLRPDAHGVRVSVRGGRRSVVDGPFAESKEIVGGYFVVAAKDRDAALALAARCPHTRWGSIEVREVMHIGGPS